MEHQRVVSGRAAWICLLSLSMVVFCSVATTAEDFSEWAEKRRQEFQEYRTEREKQFQSFLEERWREMKVFAAQREDPVPKPDRFPTATEADSIPSQTVRAKAISQPTSENGPSATPEQANSSSTATSSTKNYDSPDSPEAGTGKFSVNYFGSSFALPGATALRKLRLREVSPKGITHFWSQFAKAPTGPLVRELTRIKQKHSLDGWAYLQLVRRVSESLFDDPSLSRATTWGLLLKSGYKTRLGYNDDRLFLLIRTDSTLFEIPYFTLGNSRYYLYTPNDSSPDVKSLQTYEKDYPGELRPLAIVLRTVPELANHPRRKKVEFTFGGRKYTFEFTVNRNAVDYYETLPQVSLDKYFRASDRRHSVEDLLDQLEGPLEEIDPDQRLKFLLRFVQTAFEYKTDAEQFGRENYLLPLETLYYPYSDCEDRALLFATLVRTLLNRPVVGLDYPGHVATAVRSQESFRGSYLELNRSRFLIADPTYTNAEPGMVMPRYRNENPKVIMVDDT